MFTLENFHRTYGADKTEAVIKGRTFRFFVPATLDPFIDSQDLFRGFPLWAKIWEPSLVLADYLAGMPPDPEKLLLEIGAGLGMVGIVAAAFGHRVTLSDLDVHCLDFTRANGMLNHFSDLEVIKLDWSAPELDRSFDYIVGSEVVYDEKHFSPLKDFFKAYLKPGGEVILTAGMRPTSMEFFKQMNDFFHIKAQKMSLRSEDRKIPVLLARLTPRTCPAEK
jgi:predicted nicotinamide N-methyase